MVSAVRGEGSPCPAWPPLSWALTEQREEGSLLGVSTHGWPQAWMALLPQGSFGEKGAFGHLAQLPGAMKMDLGHTENPFNPLNAFGSLGVKVFGKVVLSLALKP